MIGIFLSFLSYVLFGISDNIKNTILNVGLKSFSLALALFVMFSVMKCFVEVKENYPEPETVTIVNEDGTVTEESGKYYKDDNENYYIRTDDWKKTFLLVPFVEPEYERVNLQICDVNNIETKEIHNKEK